MTDTRARPDRPSTLNGTPDAEGQRPTLDRPAKPINYLSPLGEKIFLDRYAWKDGSKQSLAVGDLVIVCVDEQTRQREIGTVETLDRERGKAEVRTRDGLLHRVAIEHVDKPLETSPDQTMARIARGIAAVEEEATRAEWEERFNWLLEDWKFVPGGRIWAGAGTDQQLTFYNCYVVPSPRDSRGGIVTTLQQMMEIMSRGGGVGINVSSLRPRYSYVKGVNGRSSGAVSWGGLYSFVTGLIEQGGSRRGALMLICNDWHPDILEFIHSKRESGKITNANISVGISDAFMAAVEADGEWDLVFPDTSVPDYDTLWDGDLEAWRAAGRPVKRYKTVRAREMWDQIIESAWASAEPGLWFRERSNKLSNSWYFSTLISTNPCVTGDTRIYTDQGLIKAIDLYEDQREIEVTIDGRFGLASVTTPATTVFKTGTAPKDVYRLQTKEGYYVRATADHRFMTERGWVALQQLKPGDKIHLLNRKGGFGNTGSLELGRVLGWIVGDGTLKADRAVLSFFGEEKRELAALFASYVNELVAPLTPRTRAYPVGVVDVQGRDEARVQSQRLLAITTNAGLDEEKHHVPEVVFQGSEAMQRGFLQALFTADGSVQRTTTGATVLGLASSHRVLLEETQQLLTNFGICSRIYYNRRPQRERLMPGGRGGKKLYTTKAQHELRISKTNVIIFQQEIGFLLERKNALLADRLAMYNGKLPRQEVFHAEVREITFDGKEYVFDLTEPITHSMVINGLVSHQCGEQPLPAWGICNLGALNLSRFAEDGTVKWDELRQTVRYAVRFLDNVIDATPYFFEENAEQQGKERRVGLGVMGMAEMLIRLGLRYGSEEGNAFLDELFRVIASEAYLASSDYAAEKGAFPAFDAEKYLQSGYMQGMPEEVRERVRAQGVRNVTLLTVAPTGCVAPDTLVSTEEALRPIVELGDRSGEQWQPMQRRVHTDEGLRETSHFFVNGYRPVRKLTTQRGFTLTATPNHRIRVIDSAGAYVWRRMDELQPSDHLVLKRDTMGEGERVPLRQVAHGANSLSERCPTEMTPAFAELLGLYMGDGYLKQSGGLHLVVGQKDADLLAWVQARLTALWGEQRAAPVEERIGCWTVTLNGRYIPRFFEENGLAKPKGTHGEGAEGAFVPSAVLRAGRESVAAFLRGLFESDGTVTRGTISLTSSSTRLIEQVQVALLGLGIVATRRTFPESERYGRFGARPRYELRILNQREAQKFVEQVGFLSERKRAVAAELGAMCDRGDSVAIEPWLSGLYAQSAGLPNPVRQRRRSQIANGAVTQHFVRSMVAEHRTLGESEVGRWVEGDFFLDRVGSIEEGMSDTFDLSVPDNHTYIANGFVSHNTTGTMTGTSTGVEPYYFWSYFRKSRLGMHEEVVDVVQEYRDQHGADAPLPDHFVTAMDLSPEEHVRVQAAVQRWVDSAISKCVTGDTLVLTREGLVPIAELSELRERDRFEPLEIEVATPSGFERTEAFYYGGMRETRQLSLAYGYRIEGTPNHRIHRLAADGSVEFARLDEIRVGDLVPLYGGQRRFGPAAQPLPAYSGQWRADAKRIRFPQQMSSDLAYLLGCITSEGSLSRNGIQISNSNREVLERLAALFKALFDLESELYRDPRREQLFALRVNSRPLRYWLMEDLGLEAGAANKIIPSCILRASDEEIRAFLRGLMFDACMIKDGRMFGIGLASKRLIEQLQLLFLNYGVFGRIHRAASRAWALTVAGAALDLLATIVAFDDVWKQERMAKRNEGRRVTASNQATRLPVVMTEAVNAMRAGSAHSLRSPYGGDTTEYYRARTTLNKGDRLDRDLARQLVTHFGDAPSPFASAFLDHDQPSMIYVEVRSIAKGYAEVFDLTVPGSHRFIANGLCNHNTANVPNEYTVEQLADLYRLMYDLGCKGGTVYRDGSRDEQVLSVKKEEPAEAPPAPAPAPAPLAPSPNYTDRGEHKRARPRRLRGATYFIQTPVGKAYVTVNRNGGNEPFEVFANVGKVGSEGTAMSEAIGRLVSLVLRLPSDISPSERLEMVVDELGGIGGSRSIGFGPNRITSLPDALAQVLREDLDAHREGDDSLLGTVEPPAQQLNLLESGMKADLCPECGHASLVRAEGCKKCYSCGFSEC